MPARIVLCVVILVLALPQAIWAQYGRGQQRPPNFNELKDISLEGTVEGVQGDVVSMKTTATSQPNLIKLISLSKVAVTGMAKPDYLKPGMLVSFTAEIPPSKEKTVELDQPLADLQIISASDANKPGLFNEDRDNKDSTKFFVRAPVRSYKEGKLTVVAGGKTIIVSLPPDADIKLESADLSIVRMGDTITVAGKLVAPYKSEGNRTEPGQVIAQTADIKLQETLNASTFKKKK